jgi:hypothetical protein
MIRCTIRIGFGPGIAGIRLTGLYAHTCDAVCEALSLYPGARRVSVQAVIA